MKNLKNYIRLNKKLFNWITTTSSAFSIPCNILTNCSPNTVNHRYIICSYNTLHYKLVQKILWKRLSDIEPSIFVSDADDLKYSKYYRAFKRVKQYLKQTVNALNKFKNSYYIKAENITNNRVIQPYFIGFNTIIFAPIHPADYQKVLNILNANLLRIFNYDNKSVSAYLVIHSKYSAYQIAKETGLSQAEIGKIRHNKILWSWITTPTINLLAHFNNVHRINQKVIHQAQLDVLSRNFRYINPFVK